MYPRSKAKQYAQSYDKGVSEFYDPIVRSIPGMLSGVGMAFLGDPMNPTEAMAGEEDLLRQFREDQIRSVFPKPFRSTLKGDPNFEIIPESEVPKKSRIQDRYRGGLLGGQFLMMGDGPPKDISGQTFSMGYIDAMDPKKPKLRIAGLLDDAFDSKQYNDEIELFHGTDSEGAKNIKKSGVLKGPVFLTPSIETAKDYGENIFKIITSPRNLEFDFDLPGGTTLDFETAKKFSGKDWETIQDAIEENQSFALKGNVIGSKANKLPPGTGQYVTNLFREFAPRYDKSEPWRITGRGAPLRYYTDRPSALEAFERGVTGDYLVSAEVKRGGDLDLPGYGKRGHVYALETQFDSPVTMYQDMTNVRSGNEPTLRPMTTGDIEFGNQVGEFYTKGKAGKKLHPIFDKITFKQLKGLLK